MKKKLRCKAEAIENALPGMLIGGSISCSSNHKVNASTINKSSPTDRMAVKTALVLFYISWLGVRQKQRNRAFRPLIGQRLHFVVFGNAHHAMQNSL